VAQLRQLKGGIRYRIFAPGGTEIACGKRKGTREEVGRYLEDTLLKRLNGRSAGSTPLRAA
jgi:hypothetical protein